MKNQMVKDSSTNSHAMNRVSSAVVPFKDASRYGAHVYVVAASLQSIKFRPQR